MNVTFELCSSSFGWNKNPFTSRDRYVKPGAPCYNHRGYCDVFLKCREVDPTGPLAILKRMLFSAKGLGQMKQWLIAYWYLPSTGGAALIVIIVRRLVSFIKTIYTVIKKKRTSTITRKINSVQSQSCILESCGLNLLYFLPLSFIFFYYLGNSRGFFFSVHRVFTIIFVWEFLLWIMSFMWISLMFFVNFYCVLWGV